MFDFVRSHMRVLQFILVLLIFPSFVFLGVQGYSGFGEGNATVAKVDGQKITQAEWDAAHRQQVERLRAQAPDMDLKVFDSPDMKLRTLDQLVRQRVMLAAASKANLYPSDDRLHRLFATDPQFASLRRPDGSLNKDMLAGQGMTAPQFEQAIRQDLGMQQVLAGVGDSAFGPLSTTTTALDALFQRREVRIARFEPSAYASQVQPTEADLKGFYDDPVKGARFEAPEQVDAEYVVLDVESLKAGVKVTDEELRKYYDENASRYATPEERRASHILIKADAAAPAAEREKAKAKAEGLLAEIKKNPASFAELAKKNSDDPGSAAKGGDLDFFGRGAMVKPFEDAAFSLPANGLSGVVETDFGYHIIKVTAVRGGEKQPFDAVKAEITTEVQQQLAQRKYAESAEVFSNTVYEQADSLKPVAEKLGLTVRTANNVARTPAQGVQGPLASAKFIDALFGADAMREKRNTEAVEIGPSQLVAGRVLKHTPARKLPFEAVEQQVRAALVAERAGELARKDGQAQLEAWRKGAAPSDKLKPMVTLSRAQQSDESPVIIEAALKADTATLPSWTSVDLGPQGLAVIKVDKVLARDPALGQPQQLQAQYGQLWAAAESQAYYETLKERFKVKLTPGDMAASAAAGSTP